MFKSIRWTLQLWHAGILLAALVSFGIAMYVVVDKLEFSRAWMPSLKESGPRAGEHASRAAGMGRRRARIRRIHARRTGHARRPGGAARAGRSARP